MVRRTGPSGALKRPGGGTPGPAFSWRLKAMRITERPTQRAIAVDETLDGRDVRALTEYHTVLADGPGVEHLPDVYLVVSQSGGTYHVDVGAGTCDCLDHTRRGARCKHLRRVDFATGRRPIPAWVDLDAVDPQLGYHVEGPRVPLTDGSGVIDVGERPEDCECDGLGGGLPCWPCHREGFRTPVRTARDD